MTTRQLRLHAQLGPSPSLMIIGQREALRHLGQQLLAGSDSEPIRAVPGWPPRILTIDADSPYRDNPNFHVSFHLELEPLSEHFQKKKPRYAPHAVVFLAIAFLALLGTLSIPIWIWKSFS